MSTPLSPSVTRAACCSCRPPAALREGARFGRRLHHRRPRGRRQPTAGRRTRTTRAAPAAADGRAACAHGRARERGRYALARRGHRAAARLAAQRVAVMLPKSEDAGALRHVAAQLGEHAQLVALIESLAARCGRCAGARPAGRACRVRASGFPARPRHARDARRAGAGLCAQCARGRVASRAVAGADRRRDHAHRRCRAANGRCRRARAFGFGGRHPPAQVAGVNDAMGYSEDEQAWARRVIDAAAKHGGAAFSLDGRMVDLPVIRAAEAIIAGSRK